MSEVVQVRSIKSLEEAACNQGWSIVNADHLRAHFSPLPNWYACCTGLHCPRCGQTITWEWNGGTLPGITNPRSIIESGVHPVTTGAKLLDWQHRYIKFICDGCGTTIEADNDD